MTDADIYRLWTADGPLLVAREDRIWLMGESSVGNGGLVRVTRSVPLDADEAAVTAVLREIEDELLVGTRTFPLHLRNLDRVAYGNSNAR